MKGTCKEFALVTEATFHWHRQCTNLGNQSSKRKCVQGTKDNVWCRLLHDRIIRPFFSEELPLPRIHILRCLKPSYIKSYKTLKTFSSRMGLPVILDCRFGNHLIDVQVNGSVEVVQYLGMLGVLTQHLWAFSFGSM